MAAGEIVFRNPGGCNVLKRLVDGTMGFASCGQSFECDGSGRRKVASERSIVALVVVDDGMTASDFVEFRGERWSQSCDNRRIIVGLE